MLTARAASWFAEVISRGDGVGFGVEETEVVVGGLEDRIEELASLVSERIFI